MSPSATRARSGRPFLAGLLVGCAVTVAAGGAAAAWMSRGDLAERCLEAAPADLAASQVSLEHDADHLRATLTCTWSSEGGRGPSRTIVIPLYR